MVTSIKPSQFVKEPSEAGTKARIEEMLKEVTKRSKEGKVVAVLCLSLEGDGNIGYAAVTTYRQMESICAQFPQVAARVITELGKGMKLDQEKGGTKQ